MVNYTTFRKDCEESIHFGKLDSTFIFTIAAKNYLGQVSVLQKSIRRNCGNIKFCCFVVDGFDDLSEIPEDLIDNVFDCRKLGIPHFEEMAFKYDVIEFSTSLKPYIFQHIFHVEKFSQSVYFDPDIKLYDNIDWLLTSLTSKSIIVTPHLLNCSASLSTAQSRKPALPLRSFLAVGTYNFGFVAIKSDVHGREFVDWWAEVLKDECFNEFSSGLFVDQKWSEFLPSFFSEQLEICRDPGANVAYWNMHERLLSTSIEGEYLINNSPLRFFHFSGIDLSHENGIAKKLTSRKDVNLINYSEYRNIFTEYKSELLAAGHAIRSKSPYRYNYFSDGGSINKIHRRLFAKFAYKDCSVSPFSISSNFYKSLMDVKLVNKDGASLPSLNISDIRNISTKQRILENLFKIALKVLGVNRYVLLLSALAKLSKLDNQLFLINVNPRGNDSEN